MILRQQRQSALRRALILGTATGAFAFGTSAYAEETLKIGALGVMSGPFAGWGGVMCQTFKSRAGMWNDDGGVAIGDKTYKIEVVCVDDKGDPKGAQTGAEKLVSEGVKYIQGPNTDSTAESAKTVMEANGTVNMPYAFSKSLYKAPASQSILGMVASYQVGPVIYKWLMENKGVKKIAFVSENNADPIKQRDEGSAGAKALGLEVVSDQETYESGTTDFFPILTKVIGTSPDHIVLSGVSPSDVGPLIKAARELGFTGTMSTETGQDPKAIYEVAGDAANGFIAAGGASTEAIRSDFMVKFIERYTKDWGEWNDVAGLYVYGPEIMIQTLQSVGPKALDDTEAFKAALDGFVGKNPFLKEGGELKYVGRTDYGQPRQVSVPIVVQQVENGEYKPLFVGKLPD
ncbi:amino acid/amide ABC transporter substrate-binding protein (HAAT family) [Aminobacter aminovorans]|uniref:ABC transporter substrate-binding protein n=2 Tax=Aminobacter aminovorans TaxID=83263 RepID=UPI00104533FF|nr:ABC transporter substrate-binding protein [Aminobacter aminovorans]TCS21359.1 amino acid/amide ABC transporter substrate-binding protein (HAAT family) [Aminobacter aminovorans]